MIRIKNKPVPEFLPVPDKLTPGKRYRVGVIDTKQSLIVKPGQVLDVLVSVSDPSDHCCLQLPGRNFYLTFFGDVRLYPVVRILEEL